MLTKILIGVIVVLATTVIVEGVVIYKMKKLTEEIIDDMASQLNKQQLWKFRNKSKNAQSKGKSGGKQ